MWDQMISFFISFFAHPTLWGTALAVIFGAIWLAGYWPPLFKNPWLWGVLAVSAFFTLIAITFIQIPLQGGYQALLTQIFGIDVIMRWLLLAGIPLVLVRGLVQEGAKLVPVVIYWIGEDRDMDPKMGLLVGAIAGAGFGVFEAQWALNMVFNSGWTLDAIQTAGPIALAAFWERFFVIAFHTGVSALAGYGLAKGWGWQFYLLSSLLQGLLNYTVLMLQAQVITAMGSELFIALVTCVITFAMLMLRWVKPRSPDSLELI